MNVISLKEGIQQKKQQAVGFRGTGWLAVVLAALLMGYGFVTARQQTEKS